MLLRRTSRGGVWPGVTASPDNEEHWFFPAVELTEYENRLIWVVMNEWPRTIGIWTILELSCVHSERDGDGWTGASAS